MDEVRKAVLALSEEAHAIERQTIECEDPPSRMQLRALQATVERIQRSLNRLQTAMDTWSEEREEV
jgi:hypothetical protein